MPTCVMLKNLKIISLENKITIRDKMYDTHKSKVKKKMCI